MFKLERTKVQNTQLAVYISYKSVTLKQSQGHQIYSDSVETKQDYNQANSAWEKANVKVIFPDEKICVEIRKMLVYSWCTWCSQQQYKVST